MAGNIVGGLVLLAGIVWSLQGLGLVGGSFMTGQILWLYIGVATSIVGAAVLLWNNRGRS